MKRANKAGQAQWSLRPSNILREPEAFRDLVLISRKRRQARPIRPTTQIIEQQVGDSRRQVEVPQSVDPISTAALLATLRQARNR